MHLHLISFILSYADFDPVGVFCGDEMKEDILLDDYQQPIASFNVSIRIPNGLNGLIPPEFGYLIDCRKIMLSNHISLTGQLPETMGNMSRLFRIGLHLNGLDGMLPSSLFRLKKLNSIHLQQNFGKSWTLPSNVEDINDTQLERLVLTSRFVGTIPSWIAKLKRLEVLVLTQNKFEGAIPEAIGDLSLLKHLNLMDNNLTDTIPSSLGKLDAMETLILGNNQLQGELPASIGNLRKLQYIDLGSNKMTSTIPSSFANLESLSKYMLIDDASAHKVCLAI